MSPSPPLVYAVDRPILGVLCRLGAVACLGLMFALVKLAAAHGVSVVESLFWRQLAGVPVTLVWLAALGRVGDIRTTRVAGHGLRMLLGVSAMLANFASATLLPLAEATTISFAAPIFATILAALILREPTGRWRWSAVLIGFVGVLVVARPSGSLPPLGAAVAVAGALLTAAVTIQIRSLARVETVGAVVFWFSASSLVPLGIALPFFAVPHDAAGWGLIAGFSAAGAVAQLLLTSALRFGAVGAVLVMDYTMLIWATLWGWWLFDQLPERATWIGAPIIVAAGVVIVWREARVRRERVPADPARPRQL